MGRDLAVRKKKKEEPVMVMNHACLMEIILRVQAFSKLLCVVHSAEDFRLTRGLIENQTRALFQWPDAIIEATFSEAAKHTQKTTRPNRQPTQTR